MVVAHHWERSYPPGLRWDSPLEITTLPALLEAAAARFADKTAIEHRDNEISYAELGRTTEALAAGLIKLGVRRGTSVGLYLPNTPYHPYFFFAVLKAGGRIVKPAKRAFWGGYSGYFADPDGHLWEVAHNPDFPLDAEGRLQLPSADPGT